MYAFPVQATEIYASIADRRLTIQERLIDTLGKLPTPAIQGVLQYSDPLIRWTMTNHLYRTALAVARSVDDKNSPALLSSWLPARIDVQNPLPSSHIYPLTMNIANAPTIDVGAEEPIAVANPDIITEGAGPDGDLSVAISVALLANLGFGDVITQAVGLVALRYRRRIGDEVNSWTTTALPGTIYLDWYEEPELLAKDILHEATHCWLNDAIQARGVQLPPERRYYSPWKQNLRPAYGMVHSVLAFSRVTSYLTSLYQSTKRPDIREYCRIRLRDEVERLVSVRDAALGAISVISDPEIANLVRAEYEQSIEEARAIL